MLGQVSSDKLYNYVGGLSGEWAVPIDGSAYTIATRYTWASTPIQKATRYTHDFFQSLGLPTDYDYYFISGVERRNVMAQQIGVGQPSRIILLTAHMDSYSTSSPLALAPGADDNASGSAAVMHIAEILRNYQFDCTLRYVLFTGEEQGLVGSYYYAEDVYNLGEDIEGVLNLDMIAYNNLGGPSIELHTRPGNASDLAIANLFSNAVDAYQINLDPYILQDGESFSDHASFWEFGFPAILAIEDWNDHTPDYHQATDILSTLDISYYTNFTRAALATLAHMGCLREGSLTGRVTDAASGQPLAGAIVRADLGAGQSWQTTTQADGNYQFALFPGLYQVDAQATLHKPASFSNVQVNINQNTTQNFALQPCANFTQVNFSFNPLAPGIGQPVAFSASASGGAPGYSWNFGDGGSSSGQSVNHTFNAMGVFSVTLTITNACTPTSISRLVPVGLNFSFYYPQVMRLP